MPLPKTCFDKATLADYLSEQLSESEESTIQTHLDDCAQCQQQLHEVAADQTMWSSLNQHVPTALDDASDSSDDQPLQTLTEFLAPTDDPQMIGRLGRYEICGFIGQGSTGIVVKAFEPSLNRYVAIKVLSPAYSSNGAARKRFEREGRAVASVVHSNIVPIFAVDQFRGLPYIVMQYVPGLSLLQRLDKDGPLETEEVARIGLQVAEGLAAAHKVGIVHRDVKPANVLLENTIERAMVTDFGLARVADDASMTRSGTIAGTPQYMSPEQARGESIDARSDLFSLGSLMYAACTARPPFRAETIVGVIHRVTSANPRPIREVNPKIEQWMCDFIDRLIAKQPDERFQTTEEVSMVLANELAYLQNPTQAAKPHREWIIPPENLNAELTVRPPSQPAALAPQSNPVGNAVTRKPRRRIALGTLAAMGIVGLCTVPFVSSIFDRVTSLLSPAALMTNGEIVDEENASVVESTTKNGANITWTKFESDWNTNATVTFDQKWEKTFEVDADGTLKLNIDQADVLVRPADSDNAVTVTMMRRVEAASLSKAKQIFENYKPRMSVNDDGFELTCGSDEEGRPDAIDRVVCRVEIPANYNANVELKSGDITIGELDGDVIANTGFGAIRVGHTKGNLKVAGRGGCIDLTAGCEGGADVEGVNADVYAANIGESSQLRLSGGNVWIGECKGEIYAQTSGGDIKVQNVLGKIAGFALDGDVEVRLDKSPEADCRFGTTRGELNMLVSTDVAATIQTTEEGFDGFEPLESDDREQALHERKLNGGGSIVSTKIDSGELNFAILELEEGASLSDESLGGSGPLGGSGSLEGLGGSGGLSKNTRRNFLTSREKLSDQPAAGKLSNVTIEEGGDMDGYSIYLPVSFNQNEDKYPILVTLGGSWNTGKTIDNVNNWGLSRLVRDESDLSSERNKLLLDSFVIVAPHIKKGQYSDHRKTILNIIDTVVDDYRGDTKRVYLTGLSRGGHGTWGLVSELPNTFAAIAPVAGTTEYLETLEAFPRTAVWISCNTGDGYYDENVTAMKAIEERVEDEFLVVHDPDVSETEYLEKKFVMTAARRDHHDAWTELYTRSELYKWLLQQSKAE